MGDNPQRQLKLVFETNVGKAGLKSYLCMDEHDGVVYPLHNI